MVYRTIYAFSFFIVLNLPVKVNVKRKIHNDFKKLPTGLAGGSSLRL